MTILVVDDEPAITETLCEVLTDAGYEAIAAANGKEALQAFEQRTPALVVSDVMMPKLDGRALVRAIRSREDGRRVPIILMSAAAGVADDKTIGHDLFLAKPFDLADFLERVSSFAGPGGP